MIRTEPISGSEDLVRTYSDRDMVIKQDQTGNKYIEAVDIIGNGYTYTETNIPIALLDPSSSYSALEEINNLKEQNAMLTECILEISEIVYE